MLFIMEFSFALAADTGAREGVRSISTIDSWRA